MMKSVLAKITVFCTLLVLITSCKSTKTASSSSGLADLSEMKYLEGVIGNAPSFNSFSSKMKLTVNMNGKEMTVNGTLKMKKDDVIQLSIVPLLGIEVARIEITRDSVLILDRLNRQYVCAPVSMLKFFASTDIDFYTLQSMFFNELFLPGIKQVGVNDLSAFSVQKEKNATQIRIKKSKNFNYCFITDNTNGLLTATQISSRSKYQLNWSYGDFKQLEGKNFPARMSISFDGTGKPMTAELNLSKMGTDKNWASRTTVSGKYKQIDADELIKRLLNL